MHHKILQLYISKGSVMNWQVLHSQKKHCCRVAAVWVQAKVLNRSHLVFELQMQPGVNMVSTKLSSCVLYWNGAIR